VWIKSFPLAEQEKLVKDDLNAGFGVSGLNICVVTTGLFLIAGSVLLVF
jgi:hypothetical protein